MVKADQYERYMLELINADRAARGADPLKLERNLNQAAEDHSEWMLARDVFDHTGVGGSSPTKRITDAGFDLSGGWRTAENIAVQSERGAAGIRDDVADLHQSLMNSPGHFRNLMNPDLDYIGIGIELGDFNFGSGEYESVIVTQNFASTDGRVDLDNGGSNNNDDILVPVGNAPMQQGDTIRQIATNGDAVIGSVALTLKDVSKGEIIAMQWPFVIGTMLLHLLLWLIYGYLARPTKEQISALSRNIQDLYREQYNQGDQRGYSRDLERRTTGSPADGSPSDSQMAGLAAKSETAGNAAQARPFNVHNEVNEYLRTQQNQSSSDETGRHVATPADNVEEDSVSVTRSDLQSGHHTSKLSATRAVDSVRVQIVFHDEFNMLERLAPASPLRRPGSH